MTPYDDLIARISDLIRDGDRTVKARAEDIVEAVYDSYYKAIFGQFDLPRDETERKP